MPPGGNVFAHKRPAARPPPRGAVTFTRDRGRAYGRLRWTKPRKARGRVPGDGPDRPAGPDDRERPRVPARHDRPVAPRRLGGVGVWGPGTEDRATWSQPL